MKVFKFGGASVKDAAAVRNVAEVLNNFRDEKLFIVISAMGKTTNALELVSDSFFYKKNDLQKHFDAVKKYHFDIVNDLLENKKQHTYDDIDNLFLELECLLQSGPEAEWSYDQTYDQVVSYGELFSTKIVSAYLNENNFNNRWIDCRNFILTDSNYREAKVDNEVTQKVILKNLLPIAERQLIITQGFLGRAADNSTTTLGRDGSDFSAALFANMLNAKSVTIWKDVPGVMNADPKLLPNAKMFSKLSYKETIELAYFGANVIHPKTIQPLLNKEIPLYVKSFYDIKNTGTTVGSESENSYLPVYIHKPFQTLISLSTKDFSFIVEDHLSEIFSVLSKNHLHVNLMQNSAISFSICVNADIEKIKCIIQELEKEYDIKLNENAELVSVKNYSADAIKKMFENRTVLIEQRNRVMDQFVLI